MTPSFPRFLLAAAATVAGACALGAYPTLLWVGPNGFAAMALAAGISLVGAAAGYAPVARRARAPLEVRAQAWMAGLGLRLLLTLGLALAVWTSSLPLRHVVLVWTGALYAALLVLEILVVLRSVAARAGPDGRAQA